MKEKKRKLRFFWEEGGKKDEPEFDPFGAGFGSDMESLMNEMMKSVNMPFNIRISAPITLSDSGNAFVLRAELPGFEKKDINLQVSEDRIEVSAEKKKASREKTEKGLYAEASHSRLFKSFALPGHIDVGRVEAAFKNSVLVVMMPKLQRKRQSKKVDIV